MSSHGGALVPGATAVHGGDKLRTRVTAANFSTRKATLTERVYFSRDDVYSADDVASPDVRTSEAEKATSSLLSQIFEVPALPAGAYYVIAKITATAGVGEGAPVDSDWIPLTGVVVVP